MEAKVKVKKKTQVDPSETELDELGPPPSIDDLRQLFTTDETDKQSKQCVFLFFNRFALLIVILAFF